MLSLLNASEVKMKKLALLIVIVLFVNINGQQNPCTLPESAQFDFWLGDWVLEWKDQKGNLQYVSNSIKKVLGGCVIEENFVGTGQPPFTGRSFSVFSSLTKKWHQTWVDNSGGYLDLVGEFKDSKMILNREFVLNEKKVKQRMIFYDINQNNFNWNWERSDGDGETWKLIWKINYKRKL